MPNKFTTEQFIQKSREKHGDKYDYSKVEYTNSENKVTIVCPIHGDFEQEANSHLHGHGCSLCSFKKISSMQLISSDEFIKTAKIVHHLENYDYSKTIYTGTRNIIEVICPTHGSFFPYAGNHIRGTRCKKCGTKSMKEKTRYTNEEIIKLFRDKHGDKYDYSLMDYQGYHHNIKIICPNHGVFIQEPYSHLKNNGCPICSRNILARNTQEFIEQSTKLHDSKYDYKYVNFIDSKHKVKIICPEHGEFEQLPGSHLRGMGCAACGKNVRKYPVEKHLKKWSKIHKNKYDYSLINEVSRNGTIEIICPEHGKFIQSVKSHSSGSGCPHCCRSLAEEKICDYFISKEIKFIPQYSFEDCKGDYKPLRFDFYIPCVNLLIEYDGEQHFMYIRGMHTDQKHFEKTQRYDKIKNDYAQSKGIELIRIRYDEDLQAALDKIRNKIDASKIKPMY